uniref:Uncharacterized protein AlNc14C21G2159 n=1 Tax=Albugo laibachii Nc14 TaxID=890382 RepID=F0W5J4_9STRA|nr:conserved hypothetical protein [Albugo laibachii Nc14]|eukprot:CCA16385.1 conserved hypothetical protein [Albugo laibachii Nc14]
MVLIPCLYSLFILTFHYLADIIVSCTQLLEPSQVEKLKKLTQNQNEIWQVVVRKLRVWSATSSSNEDTTVIPCRPYCILVNNLYPLGQVVHRVICNPPEVYPSPYEIMQCLVQAMLDPPSSNFTQHRPDKIVFPDKHYVGELRKSCGSINIECSYLSESEGIDSYIKQLSDHLVRKDMASVNTANERPGCFQDENGITPEIFREFHELCRRFYDAKPWQQFAERQALEISASQQVRLSSKYSVPSGNVFVSVIATQTEDSFVHGMALFITRSDLERRVVQPDEQLALMVDPRLRRCAFCDSRVEDLEEKLSVKNVELKRCTRCKCVFYCNQECQRAHWQDHRMNCVAPSETTEKNNSGSQWGSIELSILFGPETLSSFNDLDAIEKYQIAPSGMSESDNVPMYPSVIALERGTLRAPNVKDFVLLLRGLRAFVGLGNHPYFMQETTLDLIGVKVSVQTLEVQVDGTSFGTVDPLKVRNATVLTTKDVERLRSTAKSAKSTRPESKESDTQADQTLAEGSHNVGDKEDHKRHNDTEPVKEGGKDTEKEKTKEEKKSDSCSVM